MPLDRHQQVARIWDWLPAFRAAAEYQSLQRASLALAVSASALSRSIRLLEEALGVSLFSRSPSGMTLTAAGHRLLASTREAMRRIHDGIPDPRPNCLRAAATGPALLPLLCEATTAALPGWTLGFSEVLPSDAAERLRCGDLDLVLAHTPLSGPDLRAEELPGLDLVLAVVPGGDRSRVASLDEPTLAWPNASVTGSSLGPLVRLAERQAIALFAPAYAVPPSWEVIERRPAVPVFEIVRAYSAAPPAFVGQVSAALKKSLCSPA